MLGVSSPPGLRPPVGHAPKGPTPLPGVDASGGIAPPFGFDDSCGAVGAVASPSSSGIGGQYVFKTCFRAGRRIGLDKKKFIPESKHSCSPLSATC